MMKRVFIIGNGFDLNLGWKTGYWNFIESPYCPIKDSHSPLALFLRQKTEIDRWYDLEAILREYASEGHEIDGHITNPCKKDEDFFNELRYDLAAYLRKEMEKEVNKESVAAKVLYAVVDSGLFTSIYTFNYTDLRGVARQLGIHKDFTYASVHGSVEANSIILGIEDKTNIRKRAYS